jgi:hypothetical protein
MLDTQNEIARLRARVDELERQRVRTRRGHTTQKGAAEYLGKSREWLRQRERRGDGPRRNPDGTYSFDSLDEFTARNTA